MWALEKFGYVRRTSRPVGLVLACVATKHTFKCGCSYHAMPYPTYGYGIAWIYADEIVGNQQC